MSTKVEKLQDKLYTNGSDNIDQIDSEWGGGPEDDKRYAEEKRQLALDLVNLIAAAKEEERERILREAHPILVRRDEYVELYTVPASVLSPTEPEVKP